MSTNMFLQATSYKLQAKHGFTLVEILISASIFVLVVTMGFAMYTSITRLEQTTLRSQKIYTESRVWMDFLASEVQARELYYDTGLPYPSATPEDELYLVDADGNITRYFLDVPAFALKRQVGAGAIETLSSPQILVTQLDFYITPMTKTAIAIPTVTIVWKAEEPSANNPVVLPLQTTVASRNY